MWIIIRCMRHGTNDYTYCSIFSGPAGALSPITASITISLESLYKFVIEFIIVKNNLSFYLIFTLFELIKIINQYYLCSIPLGPLPNEFPNARTSNTVFLPATVK